MEIPKYHLKSIGMANGQTMIKLLLKEQFDHGLPFAISSASFAIWMHLGFESTYRMHL